MSLPPVRSDSSNRHNLLDPREYEEFEPALIELAQRSRGDLRKLLTAFFGFLHRRTDFYVVRTSNENSTTTDDADHPSPSASTMGFAPGDAEKLLLAAFRQFPLRKISSTSTSIAAARRTNPSTTSTVVVDTKPTESSSDTSTGLLAAPSCSLASSPKSDNHETLDDVRYTKEGLQIPVGNGGRTKRYTWTQTLEECTVLVGIPTHRRAKDLQVHMRPTSVSVQTKNPEAQPITFLHGTLTERIVPAESTWTLEGGVLILVLYKAQKSFWSTVLEGDEKIDTSLVDSQRHISTYDESTQAQIRKIMWEQQQIALSVLPKTYDPTISDIVRKAPTIPNLPPGVEYIDQNILDEKMKQK
jgi:hypothetical protein